MKKIKILFAEDHEMFRTAIITTLETQSQFIPEIFEARDGVEALDIIAKEQIDVFLLDMNLPKKDGIALSKILHDKLDHPKILALTMHNEDYMIRQVLDAGVLGYILKNSTLEELTRAILTVYSGDKYYSNEVAQIIINGDTKTKTGASLNIEEALTQREMEVLRLIAEEKSNKEISEILNISDRTVGNHRNNLKEKLNVKKSIGLAVFAVKHGIV